MSTCIMMYIVQVVFGPACRIITDIDFRFYIRAKHHVYLLHILYVYALLQKQNFYFDNFQYKQLHNKHC